MSNINDQKSHNCPVCNSEILIHKLASFGLTVDEFAILEKHRDNETLGTCLQLVDILMQKIEPGKLSTETEVQNMIIQVQNARLSSEAEFKEIMFNLQNTADDIKTRLAGVGVGKIGEKITVRELKAAFPFDNFTDEKASKAGTDVIGTVIESGKEQGKIAISCKYVVSWSPSFLTQLTKNMNSERTSFGILVTKSFPTQALDDKVHYLEEEKIMLVKPEFLSIAYGGFRRALLEWRSGKNNLKQVEEKYKDAEHIINKVTEWINKESNPIIKQITLIEKLCSKSHEETDKLLRQVKRFSEQSHNSEDEKLEKLSIITDAISELETFLESENSQIVSTDSHPSKNKEGKLKTVISCGNKRYRFCIIDMEGEKKCVQCGRVGDVEDESKK
jgi:hypothetical protein